MGPRLSLPRPDLRRLARSRWLPWGVAGVAVALAATFFVLWRLERSEDARLSEARATAEAFVLALTNFSGETIERDVAEIRSFAVGQFAEEVTQTFDADRLEAIRERGVRSTGVVRSVYIQGVEGSSATAFAVVAGTTTNRTSPEPRDDILRIEIALIETTEGWRVERVEILQSPQPLAG